MDENIFCLCFSLSIGVGPKTFLKLIKYFGSAETAWQKLDLKNHKEAGAGDSAFAKFQDFRKSFNLEKYLLKLKKAKVKVVGFSDENYPISLKKLNSPPIVLFCKGNLELLRLERNIGVVGARKITSYGKDVTEKLVSELLSYDFTIVSGLAFGVDATAHTTALENHGKTIAVLGCGVDCCTPSENQDLYERILDSKGLIISEYPLGMPPSAGSFPARNRIIAGLSLGVLVTEAAEDSGSLITAEESIKLGHPVFAVPGPITSQMSRGTLKLLKQGAKLVTSGQDIMENFQFSAPNLQSISKQKIFNFKLNTQEKKIVELIENEALPLDLLAKKTGIPMVKVMVIVSGLEMRGILITENGEVGLRENLP